MLARPRLVRALLDLVGKAAPWATEPLDRRAVREALRRLLSEAEDAGLATDKLAEAALGVEDSLGLTSRGSCPACSCR